MSLPKYPRYKDSGVEWLGNVPSHWAVDRLKASIVSCKNGIWGDEPDGEADDIECVRVADFDRARLVVNDEVPTKRSVSASERAGRILERGDLLLEKSGGGEKQPVGQVVLYDRDAPAICSNFVARVSLAEGMVPRFWMYQHAAAYSRGVNVGAIKQTSGIQNLDQAQYFNERGVFPSRNEQQDIADFLDRETAKIDALIAEQEKLLALLTEKRQAAISHAVTRGLNPDAPMKDSGIPWLGDVPAHWSVKKLGHHVDLLTGFAFSSDSFSLDSGIPLVRGDNVTEGELRWEGRARYWPSFDGLERFLLAADDILIGMDGSKVGKNFVRVVEDDLPLLLVQRVSRLRVDSELSPRFLEALISSSLFRTWVDLVRTDPAIPHISPHDIRGFVVPIPPLVEQLEIAMWVRESLEKIHAIQERTAQMVQLLNEHRSALIIAAVTGKIDVRGLVVEREAA